MMHSKDAFTSDVIYSGNITRCEKFWLVQVYNNAKATSKEFYDSLYEDSLSSAIQYQQLLSDQFGKTIKRKQVPLSNKMYIAGFLDGDGCIQAKIRKNKNKEIYNVIPRITFDQAQNEGIPMVLNMIKEYYGGKISTSDRSNGPRQQDTKIRLSHKLEIHGPQMIWLLLDLRDHLMLKQNQADAALKIMQTETLAEKIQLAELMGKNGMKKLTNYQSLEFESHDIRLSPEYITGLFDAEGSVGYGTTPRAHLAQKQSFSLLHAIRKKMDVQLPKAVGNQGILTLNGDNAIKFYEMILPFSLVKKEQIEELMKLRDTKKRRMCTKEYDQQCKQNIKRAKHT